VSARSADLDREIAVALARRDASESHFKVARRLQREGKALSKRFLGSRNTTEITIRDAVAWANACAWNNPPPGADDAAKERWARRWLALYDVGPAEKRGG
jgi:hypothetical protein